MGIANFIKKAWNIVSVLFQIMHLKLQFLVFENVFWDLDYLRCCHDYESARGYSPPLHGREHAYQGPQVDH